MDWAERAEEAIERYRGGETRDADQRQLTQLANSAWAAGLCLLMAGRADASREWLRRAAARYRESWEAGAPADSWGRPIAAMKSLLLAGDDAAPAARWALDAGAADAESPIGRYAGTLALLVLGDDAAARALGATLQGRDDFPQPVADALVATRRRRTRRATASRSATILALVRGAQRLPRGRPGRRHACSCSRRSPRARGLAVDAPASPLDFPRRLRRRGGVEHGGRPPVASRARGSRASSATARRRTRARAASALSSPVTRNSTSSARRSIGSVSVMRSTNGSSFASAPTARRSRLVERRLLGEERRDVAVRAEPEQHEVEALERPELLLVRRAPSLAAELAAHPVHRRRAATRSSSARFAMP